MNCVHVHCAGESERSQLETSIGEVDRSLRAAGESVRTESKARLMDELATFQCEGRHATRKLAEMGQQKEALKVKKDVLEAERKAYEQTLTRYASGTWTRSICGHTRPVRAFAGTQVRAFAGTQVQAFAGTHKFGHLRAPKFRHLRAHTSSGTCGLHSGICGTRCLHSGY